MSSENVGKSSKLEERIEFLEVANRQHAFTMELAASMVHFHGRLSHTRDINSILEESQKFLRRLLFDFKAMAYFTVDEEDASFHLVMCSPDDKSAEIQGLGDMLIDSGEFAWALNQHRGLITQSKFWGHSVFLHQLATDDRIRGMFVGVVNLGGEVISNSFLDLFSIVFRNTAYALESAELYRMLDDHNKNLEARVDQRTAELNAANSDLEKANLFVRNTFGRYMSDEVVASILDTPEGTALGGERKEVTVLMSDLRGFTALSEKLDSQEVVTILNMYLEVMTEIILKYYGTIIEFLGDGILVIFGAPITRSEDATNAVACALEMQLAMPIVNARNRQGGHPDLAMGIGINTGAVVAGNIGSEKRSKYGVVGSAINFAARIESSTIGGQLLISESTKQKCGSMLRIDDILEIQPKGISNSVNIYNIGAIGGEYNITLPEPIADGFQSIPSGVTVEFVILKNKNAGSMNLTGQIVGLTKKSAKIKSDAKLEKLQNLKLALYNSGTEITRELFGKVVGVADKEIVVALTAIPDSAARFFKEVLSN
ncbi:MAG: adenylate/guanylate cyclase domain-containing protein [Magnetococcales bacterium]|nr:adenylate/guanylate cyclase domain-containing protein [Magnetococcales bacterium]